jgi:hypothetical protein
MTARRYAILGIGAVTAIVIAAGFYLRQPAPAATIESFDGIRLGMSRGRVEQCLGAPDLELSDRARWNGSDCAIILVFRDDRVIDGGCWLTWNRKLPLREPTFLDQLYRRLGL